MAYYASRRQLDEIIDPLLDERLRMSDLFMLSHVILVALKNY